MNEAVRSFLQATGPVLCLDIGEATIKAMLARPGHDCDNWPHIVLPSPACMIAQRIREMTLLKCGIWLYGTNMGGGFISALREHLACGLSVCSTACAATAIHDNRETVEAMGIKITETCPAGCVPIYLEDYSAPVWDCHLRMLGLPQPHMVLASAMDHGIDKTGSHHGRMELWQKLLAGSQNPCNWIYFSPPEELARLKALQSSTGAPVADTATCAILGALADDEIYERSFREGVTVVNIGSSHILCALIHKGMVCGIHEQHANAAGIAMLKENIVQFRLGKLSGESHPAGAGHGTVYADNRDPAATYEPTYILGSKYRLLKDCGQHVYPYGEMRLSGCFGILYGWACALAGRQKQYL